MEQLPKLPEGKPQLEGATLSLTPDPLCLLLQLLLRAPQISYLTDVPTIPIAADCSLPAKAPLSFLYLLLFLLCHMFPLGFPSTSAVRSYTSRHRETLNSQERLLPQTTSCEHEGTAEQVFVAFKRVHFVLLSYLPILGNGSQPDHSKRIYRVVATAVAEVPAPRDTWPRLWLRRMLICTGRIPRNTGTITAVPGLIMLRQAMCYGVIMKTIWLN